MAPHNSNEKEIRFSSRLLQSTRLTRFYSLLSWRAPGDAQPCGDASRRDDARQYQRAARSGTLSEHIWQQRQSAAARGAAPSGRSIFS